MTVVLGSQIIESASVASPCVQGEDLGLVGNGDGDAAILDASDAGLSARWPCSDAAVILRWPGAAALSRTILSWCPSEIAQHRQHHRQRPGETVPHDG